MRTEILQKEEPSLRSVAKEVPIEEIKSRKINTIVRRMQKALDSQEDGVAIAAPQIGEPLRIFVLSRRIFELESGQTKIKEPRDIVFINPEIIKTSKKKVMMEEGCLSVRWLYGYVERSNKATVRAYDENGKIFILGGSGIMAQVFQHEVDHLNGILFIDKANDLREIPPQKKP